MGLSEGESRAPKGMTMFTRLATVVVLMVTALATGCRDDKPATQSKPETAKAALREIKLRAEGERALVYQLWYDADAPVNPAAMDGIRALLGDLTNIHRKVTGTKVERGEGETTLTLETEKAEVQDKPIVESIRFTGLTDSCYIYDVSTSQPASVVIQKTMGAFLGEFDAGERGIMLVRGHTTLDVVTTPDTKDPKKFTVKLKYERNDKK